MTKSRSTCRTASRNITSSMNVKPVSTGQVFQIDRIVVNEIISPKLFSDCTEKAVRRPARKYKVWGELYDRIFSGQVIEPYVLAMLIFRATEAWLTNSGLISDDVKRKIANNGSFHLARIASYMWRLSDSWNVDVSELQDQIAKLEKSPIYWTVHLSRALPCWRSS